MSAPEAEVCIFVLQWCEHVCDADRYPAVHGGAVQSPSPASENGRQRDEPSTSLTLDR